MYSAINRSIVHIARINGSVILDMQMSMASSEGRSPNLLALANTREFLLNLANNSLILKTKDTDSKLNPAKERERVVRFKRSKVESLLETIKIVLAAFHLNALVGDNNVGRQCLDLFMSRSKMLLFISLCLNVGFG